MKFKLKGKLDVPDSLASLFLGTRVDPSMGRFGDFVVELDAEGMQRFSAVLYLLYGDREQAVTTLQQLAQTEQFQQKPEAQKPQQLQQLITGTEQPQIQLQEVKSPQLVVEKHEEPLLKYEEMPCPKHTPPEHGASDIKKKLKSFLN